MHPWLLLAGPRRSCECKGIALPFAVVYTEGSLMAKGLRELSSNIQIGCERDSNALLRTCFWTR